MKRQPSRITFTIRWADLITSTKFSPSCSNPVVNELDVSRTRNLGFWFKTIQGQDGRRETLIKFRAGARQQGVILGSSTPVALRAILNSGQSRVIADHLRKGSLTDSVKANLGFSRWLECGIVAFRDLGV
jgi:hypothetical protein